jgi:UDP-glucose 4-epimerase
MNPGMVAGDDYLMGLANAVFRTSWEPKGAIRPTELQWDQNITSNRFRRYFGRVRMLGSGDSTKTGEFDWQRKRVLVTGASGFLGQNLLRLLGEGPEVIALSRSEHTDVRKNICWHQIDLSDSSSVSRVISEVRPNVVFHMSSLANGSRELALVEQIFEAEVRSSLNMLLACQKSAVDRVVLSGSFEEPEPNDPPSSPYAAAKITSRLYARMFHLLYQMPAVITRIFMSYGPGQPDWKIIPYVISSLLRGEAPRVASPDRPVDWIYGPDVCEGLLAVAAAPGVEGASIDIGSGRLTSIREIVEKLRSIIGSDVRLDFSSASPRPHEQVRCADPDATERITGWRARTSLDEGLGLTVGACLIKRLREVETENARLKEKVLVSGAWR